MKPKRKVKIFLDQRSTKDSPNLLENIANAFPKDDILIKIEFQKDFDEDTEIVQDKNLENEIMNEAQIALDKNHYEPHDELIEPAPKKQSKFKEYLKSLGLEGIKVSIKTIIKGAIELWMK